MIPLTLLLTTLLNGCIEHHSLEPVITTSSEEYRVGCQRLIPASLESAGVQPHATEECYRIPVSADRDTADIKVNVYLMTHAESEVDKIHREDNWKLVNNDPRFRDPHLTTHGIIQAMKLHEAMTQGKFKVSDEDTRLLSGEVVDGRRVIFATSNLRRAALTLLISFRHFFKKSSYGTKIHIVSALQEVSKSVDSLTLSGPREIPYLTFVDSPLLAVGDKTTSSQCPYTYKEMATIMDPKCNDGDENNRAEDSILNLCTWMRNQVRSDPTITDMILVGHENVFKTLYQTYHPKLNQPLNREELGEFFAFDKTSRLNHASMLKVQMTLGRPLRGSVHAHCSIIPTSTILLAGNFNHN
jgi:hypothetical protein